MTLARPMCIQCESLSPEPCSRSDSSRHSIRTFSALGAFRRKVTLWSAATSGETSGLGGWAHAVADPQSIPTNVTQTGAYRLTCDLLGRAMGGDPKVTGPS